jgi:hypothetical protein
MTKLDDLIAAHPLLFLGTHPPVPSHLPEGWYALVHELCIGIESILGPERCKQFGVTQVKEKFAGLRFYFSLDGAEDMYMDFHAPEGIQTLIKSAEPAPPEMAAIRELVAQAAKASRATCQKCGSLGTRGAHGGWLVTLCEKHHAERAASETERDAL